MGPTELARSWRPDVPGVREVLHASFSTHAYPAHVHEDWTLLSIEAGAVAYRLGRRDRIAAPDALTLLPPGVAHDGRAADPGRGFRKQVLYLSPDWLDSPAAGTAVDRPELPAPSAARAVRRIHALLRAPGEELEAETLLLDVRGALLRHLGRSLPLDPPRPALARALRDLLDAEVENSGGPPLTLDRAAATLGTHPSHLGRVFTRAYQVSPHRYLLGRRIDRARHLLLDGMSPADAAQRLGFHDQAHLTRHFRRILGTTPGRFTGGPRAAREGSVPSTG
ncbi:MAG: AraC family transcriptional regulator [Actinomycetales bacterium]|nr:AraC family transcriptional regulator [Actinomycetales bacterium]